MWYEAHVEINELERLIHPQTAIELQVASNTPHTFAYNRLQDIIVENVRFEVALEKWIEACVEHALSEDKAKHESLSRKRMLEEKREEKAREEIAIRELKAAIKKEVEAFPGADLGARKKEITHNIDDQINFLREKNKIIEEQIKDIDNKMTGVAVVADVRRIGKVKEFANDLHNIVIHDAKNNAVQLTDQQIQQLAHAAFISPLQIVKYNPEHVKEHKRLEEEQKEKKVKDINEIEWNKLGVVGQLKTLSLLNQFLHGDMNLLELNKIVKNNRDIGNKLLRFNQNISKEDVKTMHDLFSLSADRFAAKDEQHLNDKKIAAYEKVLHDIAADIRKENKKSR